MRYLMTCIGLVLCIAVLAPPAAQGADGPGLCQRGEALENPLSTVAMPRFVDPRLVEPQLLYFQLAADPDRAVGDEVRVRFLVDGKVDLVESIRLEADDVREPLVVEILSRHAEELGRLFQAWNRGDEVTVEIHRGDALLERQTFEELVATNRALKQEMPLPVSPPSELLVRSGEPVTASSGPALQTVTAALSQCEDMCWDERDWCYDNRCDFGGPPSCLDACDRQFEDCLDSCQPPPTCEPTTEITVQLDPISFFPHGFDCYADVFGFQQPRTFQEQLWTFKRTRRLVTHHCDGTTTSEVLDIVNIQDLCYQRFGSCPQIQAFRLTSCWY